MSYISLPFAANEGEMRDREMSEIERTGMLPSTFSIPSHLPSFAGSGKRKSNKVEIKTDPTAEGMRINPSNLFLFFPELSLIPSFPVMHYPSFHSLQTNRSKMGLM